ncbi:MAG TPA: PEP-CTERM sorting domain-containing protein [Luteolibacter sp.]|nr:PEP-CTERM sorting domain-containing protein [Luteolibacter sp.]
MNRSTLLFLPTIAAALASGQAMAAVSYLDPFTDGVLRGGADNSGINWYDRSASSTIAAFSDNGAGTLNSSTLRFSTSIGNRGFVGVLTGGAITLGAPGDFITLSFSFRVGGTIANSAQGFTYGLYSSNGTSITGDDTVDSDNDRGYRGQFATGTTASVGIVKEDNSAAGGLGTGTGTESAAVGMSSSTPVAIGTNDPHTASITLTYNSATDLGITLMFDNATVAQGTSTVPYLSFDEVVFAQGGNNSLVIDNVSVTSNVPEPGSAALLLVAVAGFAARRNRRA